MIIVIYEPSWSPDEVASLVFGPFESETVAIEWIERVRYKDGKGGWGGRFGLTEIISPDEADSSDRMLDFNFPEVKSFG